DSKATAYFAQSPMRRATSCSCVEVPAPTVVMSTLYALSLSAVMTDVERTFTVPLPGVVTVHSTVKLYTLPERLPGKDLQPPFSSIAFWRSMSSLGLLQLLVCSACPPTVRSNCHSP